MGNQTRVSIAARAARCGQGHTRQFPPRRPAWNNDSTVYVGLDVHKESITVAYAIGGRSRTAGQDRYDARPKSIACASGCSPKARHVRVVYEAGPCGYGLYRRLVEKGFDCMVCAPSLIPRKPGERVKTDRRDAIKLVRSLRAGDLSAVYVPSVEDEAFRDLARAWATARDDLRQRAAAAEVLPALARRALHRYAPTGGRRTGAG